ncbi:MAG: ABC transporter substrate-binding protein [Spirochaetes bacterium]|nr:ABC transporter substrate-binding protein [Spirochaetota bacterium]
MKLVRITISTAVICCPLLLYCNAKSTNLSLFRMYTQSDPGTLDPFFSTDVVTGRILAMICNGLFTFDERGNLVGDLAESFRFNGKELHICLRRGVLFHNGRECTADDVIFSFNRVRFGENPTSPRRWIFSHVEKIEKINSHFLSITLRKVHATFPYTLTMPACFIVSPESNFSSRAIIGTGPFKLSKWKQDERIVLLRHDRYFKGMPAIEGIEYRIIPDDLMARFEFTSGNLDYFEFPLFCKNFQIKKKYNFIDIPEPIVHYIALNNKRVPFSNARFRYGLNIAIDRNAIAKALFDSRFAIAHGPVPQSIAGYRTKHDFSLKFNPQAARKIFFELKNATRQFTLLVKADYQYEVISRMVQQFLVDAGLDVVVQALEWSALKSKVLRGDFDMAYFTWYGDYPEPENYLFPLFHSRNAGVGGNRAFYENREVDVLLERAQQTVDVQKRFDIYRQVEAIIQKDVPWIFLWTSTKRIVLSERVKGFVPFPSYSAFKANELYFEK